MSSSSLPRRTDVSHATLTIHAHLARGEWAQAFQHADWPATLAEVLGADPALQQHLLAAGHARMLSALPSQACPTGIVLLGSLLRDAPLPPLRAWYEALAATPSDDASETALITACLLGHEYGHLPAALATTAQQRLGHMADRQAAAGDLDAAAQTLLRLADALGESAQPETALALAVCERAERCAQTPSLRYAAQLATLCAWVRAGLAPHSVLQPHAEALSSGRAPVEPGLRIRLFIGVASTLLGHHPQAPDWLQQAAILAAQTGHPLPACQAHLQLAHHRLAHGAALEAATLAGTAQALADTMAYGIGRCSAEHLLIQIALGQGHHDRALAQALRLGAAMVNGHALPSLGPALALTLAQLGASHAGHAVLDALALRLRRLPPMRQHAELQAARAACLLAEHQFRAAQRAHREARRLSQQLGDPLRAAEQSLALTQVAFAHSQSGGPWHTVHRAHRLAQADCALVPADALPTQRAALAQIAGQLSLLSGDTQAGRAHLHDARERYAAAGDLANAGFAEALRGLTLLAAGQQGEPAALDHADQAFRWAQRAFIGRLPHAARTMLFYRALVQLEQLERHPDAIDETGLDLLCSLVRSCLHQVEHHAHSNPMTCDASDPLHPNQASLIQRLRALFPRIARVAAGTAQVDALYTLLRASAAAMPRRIMH